MMHDSHSTRRLHAWDAWDSGTGAWSAFTHFVSVHVMPLSQVKATPTFLIYRKGELIETVTGTGAGKLARALLAHLKDGERGREWAEATHTSITDSDDSEVENE